MSTPDAGTVYRQVVSSAARDENLVRHRTELAGFIATVLSRTGTELHVAGHLLGDDRKSGQSPFGHGSDEHVAVSVLLRISGQLVFGSVTLFEAGIPYAAAALIRQMVEVEYLAWASVVHGSDCWLMLER